MSHPVSTFAEARLLLLACRKRFYQFILTIQRLVLVPKISSALGQVQELL